MRLGEIIALQYEDLDFDWNVIHVRHSFASKEKKLKAPKNGKERLIYTDANILDKFAELYRENPHSNSFIFWGLDPIMPMRIETIEGYFEKAANALLGEDVRKERNITFHSFRHFFNSTIRGSVSDDILRLQTGHLSEKMTDHYDHMTDERGELLRTAIRNKILPFVQAEGE